MELFLGGMSNDDLAAWFGIQPKTFKSHKKKKLEVLKNFCKFEETRGGVKVLEIYEPVYSKKLSKARQTVENEFEVMWSDTGLDTCSRVGLAIKKKMGNELSIKESTAQKYAVAARNELYGKPYQGGGRLGNCVMIWCKKEGDGATAKYEFLTEEETKIKDMLLKKYYGNATEKQLIVQDMVDRGEITKEEAWDILEALTGGRANFYDFLCDLQEQLGGVTIVRGTLINKQYKEIAAVEEGAF